jgi:hypothetical protein
MVHYRFAAVCVRGYCYIPNDVSRAGRLIALRSKDNFAGIKATSHVSVITLVAVRLRNLNKR